MDILYSNSSAENVKIIRNYRNLMDEIDALVPYEEREYREEEDTGQDRGCWEDGGTIEGLLAYITRIRDENKTLKDDADRWEHHCLYAEEWEDKYANGVLGRKKKNEIYADSGGDDDYRQAILDEIKTLKDENTKLKITMKRISLLVAEQELDALKQ